MRAISGPADRSPLISAPTVKARVPAPVSTMARQLSSRSSSSHSRPSSASIARVIALRRGWLSIVTIATCRPCRARRISIRLVLARSGPYRTRDARSRESRMKAMVCRAWGAPDVLRLENIPPRALRPGEVRIRVRSAGVNFADSLMVGGTYQVKPPFPFTPGLEAAGEVIEIGSGVIGLRTGQRVRAVLRYGGGYAEEIVLDAATVVPIPEAVDFVTAAAFPVAYGTAHFALVESECGAVALVAY